MLCAILSRPSECLAVESFQVRSPQCLSPPPRSAWGTRACVVHVSSFATSPAKRFGGIETCSMVSVPNLVGVFLAGATHIVSKSHSIAVTMTKRLIMMSFKDSYMRVDSHICNSEILCKTRRQHGHSIFHKTKHLIQSKHTCASPLSAPAYDLCLPAFTNSQ